MSDIQRDERLTAYALGELTTDERAAMEREIAASEDGRREVEEIREAAATLREAFGTVPRHEMTAAQRQAVEDAAARPIVTKPRARLWSITVKVAAVLAVVAAVGAVAVPSLLRARVSPRYAKTANRAIHPPPPVAAATPPPPEPKRMSQEEYERLQSMGYLPGPYTDYADQPLREPSDAVTTESYDHITDNAFVLVAQDPRSTFSIDVDTASYSIVRRYLNAGQLPPKDAVRIEEMINYFPYAYPPPKDGRPFAVHMDVADCPWAPAHRLVRIGLKGRELPRGERPAANLVFLLDVSGSMDEPDKLPLVKAAMRLLVEELRPDDRVAIVVYAGAEGLALPSTPGTEASAILSAIESLSPDGATHASAGIRLAYQTAAAHFIPGGINRVILATDGDFNVGVTSEGDLVRLIETKAKSGVFLTALGFGRGNLKDSTLEKLADRGNGNYAYIDTLAEARKVLVEQAGGTLVTIAKDVKLQLEFNPRRVRAFRLIGYENRVLAHQEFNDDARDAGDIGAGHTVTALYEIVPPGVALTAPGVDPLKYQSPARPPEGPDNGELLTVKLRYKAPEGDRSALMEVPLRDSHVAFEDAHADFRFAAAVAAFGMSLRESPHRGDADLTKALTWARGAMADDPGGHRREFAEMTAKALSLRGRR